MVAQKLDETLRHVIEVRPIEILLGRTEPEMVNTVMVRHVGTWDRRSDYARIVGLVEGDNMLWKAEKGLENKIETRSGVQVPRAFKDHVKVLGVEDEIGFERSKANTD